MQKTNRFVFDTNVLVSSMLFPKSIPALALQKAINTGKIVVSAECMEELSRVVLDEKFEKYSTFSRRQMFLLFFENICEFIKVKDKIILSRDLNDNKFLSLSKAAKANCIVS